jgi:hypothetical protein
VGAGVPALPLGIRGGLPSPLLPAGVGRAGAAARTRTAAAASLPAEDGGGKPEGATGISRNLQLGATILVWYMLNIYFNICNKLVRRFVPILSIPGHFLIDSSAESNLLNLFSTVICAGSQSRSLSVHHHHLPVRIRILLHHTHVAAESASQTKAFP